jgi:enolase
MTIEIRDLHAIQVLDSRARPTLSVILTTAEGLVARSGVPSGASTGSREAVELRDGDQSHFAGQGVTKAVANVNGEIATALKDHNFKDLADLDHALIDMDGTPDKSRLGANAIVGVSMAAARAVATIRGEPLWATLKLEGSRPRLPVPHFNVINGGVHAPNALDFQEFMVVPVGAANIAEAVRAGAEVYAALRRRLSAMGLSTGLGDEGGFAPEIAVPEEVLAILVSAIADAGYEPGLGAVALALDPASSEFYDDGAYQVAGDKLTTDEMIERYAEMVDRFPVCLLEDGLAESDWDGWEKLTARLGEQIELVGDDLLCTNPAIIASAIERRAGNAALIKVNQIGTVTETLEAMRLCVAASWRQFVSHRSGETEDSFIADLAVGTGCGQMKTGAPARGERVAKYNRLIEIEDLEALPYGPA